MQPENRDVSFLWDMLRYSRKAIELASHGSFETYLRDETCRLAMERTIEIVGEAARNISESFQEEHPEIPWQKIVAQRHVIAHDYDRIRDDLIWRIATVHAPALVAQLEGLLPDPPSILE